MILKIIITAWCLIMCLYFILYNKHKQQDGKIGNRYFDNINSKTIVKGSNLAKKEDGITPDKKYIVIYKGKDETGVINDFGESTEYSDDHFENI